MATECTFPACPRVSGRTNRADQPMCEKHLDVVVSGSYVNDRHTDGGHG